MNCIINGQIFSSKSQCKTLIFLACVNLFTIRCCILAIIHGLINTCQNRDLQKMYHQSLAYLLWSNGAATKQKQNHMIDGYTLSQVSCPHPPFNVPHCPSLCWSLWCGGGSGWKGAVFCFVVDEALPLDPYWIPYEERSPSGLLPSFGCKYGLSN